MGRTDRAATISSRRRSPSSPRLADWRARIIEATGVVPVLAGSGATWFLRGAHADAADALPDATVVVTRTDRP